MVKLAESKQLRLDELLGKNSEGSITESEQDELEQLVDEAEQVMVENSKRLASYASAEGGVLPINAVPVTVWIKPECIEQ